MDSRVVFWVAAIALGVACGAAEDEAPNGHGGGSSSGGVAGSGGVGGRAGAGGGGDGGAGGEPHRAGLLRESSWDTALSIQVVKQQGELPIVCTSTAFTTHFSPRGESVGIISGRDGTVYDGELQATDASGTPPATFGLSLPIQVPTLGGDCELFSIVVADLTLRPVDTDGDGIADIIEGSGNATGEQIYGDQIFEAALAFTWRGLPDTTAPALLSPARSHPLNRTTFRATEPLALDTELSLVNGAGDVLPLAGSYKRDGALSYFSTAMILPFGTTWSVQGTGADLAGLDLDLTNSPSVTLLDDPLLFAQDGFESVPNALLAGGAEVVTSVGDLPAITGSHSLLVLPDSSATFHLARPALATRVRFNVRRLVPVEGSSGGILPVEVGVVGGTQRVGAAELPPDATLTPTHHDDWAYAGELHDVSIELIESGSDVVMRIEPLFCGGLCPPPEALFIDDLRVE